MTVAELIGLLQAMPQDAQIIHFNNWEMELVQGVSGYRLEGDHYGKPGEVRLGRGLTLGDSVVELG